MRKNKIGAVFLISTLALAGLGIGYAGFFDDISVYGSVDTATVTLTTAAYSGTWVYKIWGFAVTPPNPPAGWAFYDLTKELLIYRGFTNLTTAVTSWASTNGGHAELEAGAYAEIGTTHNSQLYDVDMVWWNIFPCIDFTADFIIHYTGTIPAHITFSDLVWDTTGTNFNFGPYTIWHAYWYTLENGVWVKGTEIASTITTPIQMHYCQYVGIEVTVHLLQDNNLQNKNGAFSFNIHALQWNDLCEPPSGDKVITLPTGIYNVWFEYPVPNYYFNAHLSGIPAGNPYVWDGSWPCWCVDQDYYITPGNNYLVKLYSTYDPINPYPDSDWPKVNWIINHKGDYPTATKDDFQAAIWYFVDHGVMPGGIGANIVAGANANGATFIPQTGQLIAVLLWPVYPNGNPAPVQKTIIEVDP